MRVMTSQPFVLRSDEGESLDIGPATVIVKASAGATGGAFTLFVEPPPLLDTSLHVHDHEDEMYYVLEGDHEFTAADTVFRVGPGDFIFLPRRIPHAHRRLRPGEGRLLGLTSPAGLEGFFRLLADAAQQAPPGEDAYADASRRHGITWLP